jgi:hypothetical protein
MFEKSHHICTGQGAIGASQVEPAIAGECTQQRAMVAREGFSQHRCLANRCIGTEGGWQQIEARLDYED